MLQLWGFVTVVCAHVCVCVAPAVSELLMLQAEKGTSFFSVGERWFVTWLWLKLGLQIFSGWVSCDGAGSPRVCCAAYAVCKQSTECVQSVCVCVKCVLLPGAVPLHRVLFDLASVYLSTLRLSPAVPSPSQQDQLHHMPVSSLKPDVNSHHPRAWWRNFKLLCFSNNEEPVC